MPFTSTVNPAISMACSMKLAVGTERLTGVSGFALSMLVESAWNAQAGASTIHTDVSSMSNGG